MDMISRAADFVLGGALGVPFLHLPITPLEGRTIVVSGSNIGLGYETVLHLARLNPALIIIACRDEKKGEAARAKVIEITKFQGKIKVWLLDLASFQSVKDFSVRLNELERLDVLVGNAGIAHFRFEKTINNWESILQVNVLSTGLLAVLELPVMKRTAENPLPYQAAFKPHLTIVTSELHGWAQFPQSKAADILKALNEDQIIGSDRYNLTKLMEIFMVKEISKLSISQNLIINSVNPDLCISAIFRDIRADWWGWALNLASRTGEQGARNIAFAAAGDTNSGAYVSFCREMKAANNTSSADALTIQEKIWKELVELWVAIAPEVKEIIG